MMNLPPASTISVPAGSAGAPVSPDQTRAILSSVMRIRALAIGTPPVPSIKVPPRTSRLAPFAWVKGPQAKTSRHSENFRWPISRIRPIADNLSVFLENTEVIGYGTNSTDWPSEVFTMPAGLRLGGFDASERGQPAGSRWNFDRWNGRRSYRQRPNSHNRRQDCPRLVRRHRGAGASRWNRNRRSRRQVHHSGTYRFARSLQLVHG